MFLNNQVHLSVLLSFVMPTLLHDPCGWACTGAECEPHCESIQLCLRGRGSSDPPSVMRSNRAQGKGMASSCLFISVWLTASWTPTSCSGFLSSCGCRGRGYGAPTEKEGGLSQSLRACLTSFLSLHARRSYWLRPKWGSQMCDVAMGVNG